MRDAAHRLLHADVTDELFEEVPVLRQSDVFRRGADDGGAGGFQPGGEVQGRLSAVLNDDAVTFFLLIDLHDVLEGQRLEVELVGGVVVRGDGLRVGVLHDDFEAFFFQGEGRMAAAPVELYPLADAVGTAAQDHDALLGLFLGLLLLLFKGIVGVVVGRLGFEFARAGVHGAEDGMDIERFSFRSDIRFFRL